MSRFLEKIYHITDTLCSFVFFTFLKGSTYTSMSASDFYIVFSFIGIVGIPRSWGPWEMASICSSVCTLSLKVYTFCILSTIFYSWIDMPWIDNDSLSLNWSFDEASSLLLLLLLILSQPDILCSSVLNLQAQLLFTFGSSSGTCLDLFEAFLDLFEAFFEEIETAS